MGAESFNKRDRQPIIPLSLEAFSNDATLARAKEFIIDYVNSVAYIKIDNGSLLNITASESTLEFVKQYLLDHPEIILSITTTDNSGVTRTLQESFDYIYSQIVKLENKEYLYAGSTTDGGPANRAEKVEHGITIKETGSDSTYFDGSDNKQSNISRLNLFSRSGGTLNGDMVPKKKFLLGEGISYGMTLPPTGVEGQVFILLREEV